MDANTLESSKLKVGNLNNVTVVLLFTHLHGKFVHLPFSNKDKALFYKRLKGTVLCFGCALQFSILCSFTEGIPLNN